jgi:hypothetical protein
LEVDKAITRLGERLDEWLQDYLAASDTNDRLAQRNALLHGINMKKELDQIKVGAFAAVAASLDRQDFSNEDERVATLIRGFILGAKLKHALHDTLMDTDGVNKAILQTNAIANALDAIGSGRRLALAPLLDHPDVGVRASAGAYLVALMPDRVISTLREIDEHEGSGSAGLTAYWARRGWELDGK